MRETIDQLAGILGKYIPLLNKLSEAQLLARKAPDKWSKKEILGHLIDSAQNNIRRFVIAQYQENEKIVYAQDEWVKVANYHNYPTPQLIRLWTLLNQHMHIILQNMPEEKYRNICVTGEPHTIEWLAADYNKHLLHHLNDILELEPVAYP